MKKIYASSNSVNLLKKKDNLKEMIVVAKEYIKKSHGQKVSKLPKTVKKK